MLRLLRAGARTWVAKVLFVLLVGSFAVWGVSGSMFTGAGDAVVTVGDTKVTPTEFRLAYDRELARLSQQFGTRLTQEQARALGVEGRVYAQVINGAALDELAEDMNLGLSRDRLAGLISEDPAFQGLDGDFSRQAFSAVLRNVGMSEENYIRSRENDAVRTQIVEAVADGFALPETLLDAVARHRAEARTLSYMLLDESMIEPVGEPSEEELQAYFEENRAAYRAPEYRKIAYVPLTAEDVADPASISDEQVREFFENNRDRYTTPERRTLDQLVFADEDAARAAADRLAAGASFEDVVESEGRSMQDVRIGTFSRDEMSSDALAEAAFSVEEEGGMTGVVDGPFGPVILRVAAIEEGETQSFQAVSGEIRQDLAMRQAGDVLFDVYNGYEDARAAGLSLVEAARDQKLDPVIIEAVDRNGMSPEGEPVEGIPQSAELLAEAFESEVGEQAQPLSIGSRGYVWYEVVEIEPERERSLKEVRAQVVADWRAERTAQALAERAEELRERIVGGETLREVAEDVGTQVRKEYGLQRQSDDPIFGQRAIAAAFSGPKGHVAAAPAADGTRQIVMRVDEIALSASSGLTAREREALGRSGANDLLQQVVARLRERYPIDINQTLGQQALSY